MPCFFRSCKYGKIEDSYQYCETCGKARVVECPHKWKTINIIQEGNILTDAISNYIYILQCTNCGEIKQEKTK